MEFLISWDTRFALFPAAWFGGLWETFLIGDIWSASGYSLLQRKKDQILKPVVRNTAAVAAEEEGTKESNVEPPEDAKIDSKVADKEDEDAVIIVTHPKETIISSQ